MFSVEIQLFFKERFHYVTVADSPGTCHVDQDGFKLASASLVLGLNISAIIPAQIHKYTPHLTVDSVCVDPLGIENVLIPEI